MTPTQWVLAISIIVLGVYFIHAVIDLFKKS
jgi:hypothetical protein